jgi:hypothetical protein
MTRTRRERDMTQEEQRFFINRLRSALGMGPLYDRERFEELEASSYLEEFQLPCDGKHQEFFQARAMTTPETRDEKWSRQISTTMQRRQIADRKCPRGRFVYSAHRPARPGARIEFRKRVRP